MTIQFQPAALAGSIALALGFASSVYAAEQRVAKVALDTIVVTATRSEEKIENVPARISIIEPQVLEQSPIASFPELLKSEASANIVQLGDLGQQSSIFLRGTNSTQTLVLRDGVRLNTATTGAASIPFLDTTDIKQIEILKGPASVLYGTDAIGGVIQLISKTPEKTSAFVTGEIGENKTYKSLVGADLAEDGLYAQIRGQRLETDGTAVKEIKNNPKAAFEQKGYSAKIGVDKDAYGLSLDYSQNEGNSQYDNFGALTDQDFKNEIINLKGHIQVQPSIELNARLSQFKDDLYQNDPNYLGELDYVLSKTQEAELYGKWQITPHQNILLGSTFQNIKGDVLSYGKKYDTDVDSQGYYIQHQYNHSGLNTQVGLRIEDHEQYGTHTIGQAAVRYQILPLTSIYTNIGTAFRSPTLNELYSSSGNPDLKPEESISYEIGLDQKLTYGFSSGISLYRNQVDHLIDATGATGYKFKNLDKATFEGTEVYLKWAGEHLYANATYNYVRAQDDSTNEDLSRRPRQKAAFTTGWQEPTFGFSTTLTANSSSDNSAYDNVRIPGHFNIDMHGYYNVNEAVKLFANIQNVGDSKYRTAYGSGSYYINGGRLASAGVTFKY
ncbi:TonB-dependent receptor plug domain-containing protein [Acinetobacter schindleri]|uniref:TonB-dependent receptor plug domain-containing protein n=1 Tax=Acinetobacter schindleri TaxID=108981 RepID=UPI0013B07079|nr:TonB-dependent receptor [Acinetobacter schindleri]QIC63362.1 TonB-dependent receptor [Acinetobacter schindleri]